MTIQLIREGRFGVATLTANTINGPVTLDLQANRNLRNCISRQRKPRTRFVTLASGIQQLTF